MKGARLLLEVGWEWVGVVVFGWLEVGCESVSVGGGGEETVRIEVY